MLQIPKFPSVRFVRIGSYSPNCGVFIDDEIPIEGRSIPVYPQERDYEVELEADHGATDVSRIDGLGTMALFQIRAGNSCHLLEGQSLEWGSAYALVQRRKIDLNAFPGSVPTKGLAKNDEWFACLFGLPAVADSTVAGWIAEMMGRSIRDQISTFVVLSPVASRLESGTWIIPTSHRSVIVSVRLNSVPRRPINLALVSNRGVREETRLVTERPEVVVDLGRLDEGLFELRTESLDADIPTLRLDVRNREDYHVPARITFAFERENTVRNVTLWDAELSEWFAQVRSGQADLDEIRLPNSCHITVTVVGPNVCNSQTYSFDSDSGEKSTLLRELVDRVRALLTANERFELEGHGFGHISFPPPTEIKSVQVPANRESTADLPADRAKRAWLQLALRTANLAPLARFIPHSDRRVRFAAHLHCIER